MWPFKKKNPVYAVDHPTKDLILSDVVEVKAEEIPPAIDKTKYKDCDIERMPIGNKYYPRYKGKYIWWHSTYGWRPSTGLSMCEHFSSVEECIKFFDKFLEEVGVTSEIIKI